MCVGVVVAGGGGGVGVGVVAVAVAVAVGVVVVVVLNYAPPRHTNLNCSGCEATHFKDFFLGFQKLQRLRQGSEQPTWLCSSRATRNKGTSAGNRLSDLSGSCFHGRAIWNTSFSGW